jgi:hypothetical protein
VQGWSPEFLEAASALPSAHHLQALCAAYTFQDRSLFSSLLDLAFARTGPHGDLGASQEGAKTAHTADQLGANAALNLCASALRALAMLDVALPSGDVSAALTALSTALYDAGSTPAVTTTAMQRSAVGHTVQELMEDAAVRLWLAARPLVDGVVCMRDKEAPLVATVLAAVHAAFEVAGQDDAVLRHAPIASSRFVVQSASGVLCATLK